METIPFGINLVLSGNTSSIGIKGKLATLIKNGFLVVHTFSLSDNAKILQLLKNNINFYNGTKQSNINTLVFTPFGNLYEIGESFLFSNPITRNSIIQENWSPINPNKFSKYTNSVFNPNSLKPSSFYFASLPYSILGSEYPVGSGWFLYTETDSNLVTSFYILQNPMNVLNGLMNYNADYQTYCQFINYQDDGCYCLSENNNDPMQNTVAEYAYLNSKSTGSSILAYLRSNPTRENIQALDSIVSTQTCNSICALWGGMKPSVNCVPSTNVVNLCNVSFDASDESTINANGLQITQDCSGSPASGSPASGSPASGSPASGSPASGSPASGSPASGSPASGSPASGSFIGFIILAIFFVIILSIVFYYFIK